MSRLLTVKQAKRLLGKKSVNRVYDLVARGIIPPGPLHRQGRAIRFNEDLLIDWIEAGGTAALQKEEARDQEAQLAITNTS